MRHLLILVLTDGDFPFFLIAIAVSPIVLLLGLYAEKREFKKAKELTAKWARDRGMTLIDFYFALNRGPFKKPTLWDTFATDERYKRYYQFTVVNESGRQFSGWVWYKSYKLNKWDYKVKLANRIKP